MKTSKKTTNSKIVRMGKWLQTLDPTNLTADFYIEGKKKSFSASNWSTIIDFAQQSSPDHAEADVIVEQKTNNSKVVQSYAMYRHGKWCSMPAEDVKLLCSLDTKKGTLVKAPPHLQFATFGQQFPGSPVKGLCQNLGLD